MYNHIVYTVLQVFCGKAGTRDECLSVSRTVGVRDNIRSRDFQKRKHVVTDSVSDTIFMKLDFRLESCSRIAPEKKNAVQKTTNILSP
jgi:hypothetical protein